MASLALACGPPERPPDVPVDWKPVDYHSLRIWVPGWPVHRAGVCGEPQMEVWIDTPAVVGACGSPSGPPPTGARLQTYQGNITEGAGVNFHGLRARHLLQVQDGGAVYRDRYAFTDLHVTLAVNASPPLAATARAVLNSVQQL